MDRHLRLTCDAQPYIHRRNDTMRPEALQAADELAGIGHCHAADHDASGAGLQQRSGIGLAADAAAALQLQALAHECGNAPSVGASTIMCAVQVNNVQPARAEAPIARQQQRRTIGIGVRGRVVTLTQPDHRARAQVYCGNQFHRGAARKFARILAPVPAERSG